MNLYKNKVVKIIYIMRGGSLGTAGFLNNILIKKGRGTENRRFSV